MGKYFIAILSIAHCGLHFNYNLSLLVADRCFVVKCVFAVRTFETKATTLFPISESDFWRCRFLVSFFPWTIMTQHIYVSYFWFNIYVCDFKVNKWTSFIINFFRMILLTRPARIAELPRSKCDPELFPHSAYVEIFVTFATKVPYLTFCNKMPEYDNVYQSMPMYARVCNSMP